MDGVHLLDVPGGDLAEQQVLLAGGFALENVGGDSSLNSTAS
jgi:hypothetical protein